MLAHYGCVLFSLFQVEGWAGRAFSAPLGWSCTVLTHLALIFSSVYLGLAVTMIHLFVLLPLVRKWLISFAALVLTCKWIIVTNCCGKGPAAFHILQGIITTVASWIFQLAASQPLNLVSAALSHLPTLH